MRIKPQNTVRRSGQGSGGHSESCLFEVRNSFATENDIRELQTAVTYVKNMRYTEEEIRKYQTPVQKLPEIYQAYQKGLKEKSLIDYDDQMVYALQFFSNSRRCAHIFRKATAISAWMKRKSRRSSMT
ncbi:MAG: UvrD-helicase domain-containing protein [Lachnospiraceae bacterium]